MTVSMFGPVGDSPAETAGSWAVLRSLGEAATLTQRPGDAPRARLLRICEVVGPALILGSTQPEADVDGEAAARLGLAVCRRASGGGAVIVRPGSQLWLDAFLPAGDRLLVADVGTAFLWLGEAVGAAIGMVTRAPVEVHPGPPVKTRWSSKLCFSGLGPGEIRVAGRKVFGVSQRRGRSGAWFYGMTLCRFDSRELAEAMALGEADRAAAAADLAASAGALECEPAELEGAVLQAFADLA